MTDKSFHSQVFYNVIYRGEKEASFGIVVFPYELSKLRQSFSVPPGFRNTFVCEAVGDSDYKSYQMTNDKPLYYISTFMGWPQVFRHHQEELYFPYCSSKCFKWHWTYQLQVLHIFNADYFNICLGSPVFVLWFLKVHLAANEICLMLPWLSVSNHTQPGLVSYRHIKIKNCGQKLSLSI